MINATHLKKGKISKHNTRVKVNFLADVPVFIKEGESVREDTRTGEFVERVK